MPPSAYAQTKDKVPTTAAGPLHTSTFLHKHLQVLVTLGPNTTTTVQPGNPVTFTYRTAPFPGVTLPPSLRAEAKVGCASTGSIAISPNASFGLGGLFTVTFTPDPGFVDDPNNPADGCAVIVKVFDASDSRPAPKVLGISTVPITYPAVPGGGGSGGGGSTGDVSVDVTCVSPPYGSLVKYSMSVTEKQRRRHLLADNALEEGAATGAAHALALPSRVLLAGNTLAIVIDWGDGSPRWRSPLDGLTLPATLAAQHTYAGQSASGAWTVVFFIEKVCGRASLSVSK